MKTLLQHALIACTLVITGCRLAGAHPGHGSAAPTSAEHLFEPVHMLPALCVALLLALAVAVVVRRWRRL